ncbi:hypothetical protein RUND412_001104 [Rhizina undulata]
MAEYANTTAPTWPPIPRGHPLRLFAKFLKPVLDETSYGKIWGIQLQAPRDNPDPRERADGLPPFHTLLVMQKFLRAYGGDWNVACWKLRDVLLWLKELTENFVLAEPDYEERSNCGYVTTIPVQLDEEEAFQEKVVIFYLHGEQYERHEKNFLVQKFVPLRVSLMEQAISQLSLATATIPIPDFNPDFPTVDPYTVIEVCDFGYHTIPESYEQIQTSITIADNILRTAYPGFVERIYVVNVFRMTTHLIPFYSNFNPGAVIKFLGDGTNLVEELGEYVPENYGGEGEPLHSETSGAEAFRVVTMGPQFNWQSFWIVADAHRDEFGLSMVDMSED